MLHVFVHSFLLVCVGQDGHIVYNNINFINKNYSRFKHNLFIHIKVNKLSVVFD